MTVSIYRTPGHVEPTLTPEEEKSFHRALRPTPWFTIVYAAFWAVVIPLIEWIRTSR